MTGNKKINTREELQRLPYTVYTWTWNLNFYLGNDTKHMLKTGKWDITEANDLNCTDFKDQLEKKIKKKEKPLDHMLLVSSLDMFSQNIDPDHHTFV